MGASEIAGILHYEIWQMADDDTQVRWIANVNATSHQLGGLPENSHWRLAIRYRRQTGQLSLFLTAYRPLFFATTDRSEEATEAILAKEREGRPRRQG